MSRFRSIRFKIIIMLVIPVVAMAGLWVFTLAQTVAAALDLRTATQKGQQVGRPGDMLAGALQQERRATRQYLAATGDNAALNASRNATDQAIAAFRRLAGDYHPAAAADSDLLSATIKSCLDRMTLLPNIRADLDSRSLDQEQAAASFDELIDTIYDVLYAAAEFSDPGADRQMHTLVEISYARELSSREDALLTAALTRGKLDQAGYLGFVQLVGAYRSLSVTAAAQLPYQLLARYNDIWDNPEQEELRTLEESITRNTRVGHAPPVTASTWRATFTAADKQLRSFLTQSFEQTLTGAKSTGNAALLRTGAFTALGLLVILISVVVSVRNGGTLVRRLIALRSAATRLAHEQLPDTVSRLRAGEDVDLSHEADLSPDGHDEIAEVRTAFDEVQRSALESAVSEAHLRRGMSRVFVNIARRSQGLIQRQLTLLDQFGHNASTPEDAYANLTLAARLAVRLRRQAESLVILAGETPNPRLRAEVPLADVVGDAIRETEAAARVEVLSMLEVALPGRTAPDLVHLLAELLDNAAAYSPPQVPIELTVSPEATGICIEIEDRGLGMTDQALEDINTRLSQAPDFDPADSNRLGLFVVARLADRRGLRVRLRPSENGGITAAVSIPPDVLQLTTPTPAKPHATPDAARPLHAVTGPTG